MNLYSTMSLSIFITCNLLITGVLTLSSNQFTPSLGDTSPGSVWPQPQVMQSTAVTHPVAISAFNFVFEAGSSSCGILDEAFKRYGEIIYQRRGNLRLKFRSSADVVIKQLEVSLTKPCEDYPSLNMDEAYSLVVKDVATLRSQSVWGVLRGLETFSQLLWQSNGEILINETAINDYPRYSHRGILLDTSRHYLPLNVILQNLDAMAYDKFNVFHWHIVDDQSFPFVSNTFPDLSEKGAYTDPSHIYTPEDVAAVIEYARLRGIRVVPEFDSPGHTQSWGKGQPGFLTPCYKDGKPDGTFGPVDPMPQSTYTFMSSLLKELRMVFHDKYIHLGGDEVDFTCWKTNPNLTSYMQQMNITGNYAKLEQIYIQKVLNLSKNAGFSYVIWQEVFDNGVVIEEDTVVEVWKGSPETELAKVTAKGYRALISSPWYLNYISYGEDWMKYYTYEPTNFNGTDQQKALVMGGEACMWSEWVDGTNLLSRLWPRASTVAERLWSAKEVNNTDKATPRLHQHRCNLVIFILYMDTLYKMQLPKQGKEGNPRRTHALGLLRQRLEEYVGALTLW